MLHPGWVFTTWRKPGALGWMRCKDEFDRAETLAGKSDVARYEILEAYGGIYLDTDVEPLRRFDDLLGPTPFIGWEDSRLLCPTVMGSPAHHPAIEQLLDQLPRWVARHQGKPPNQATGPHFVTAAWRRRTDVRRLPPAAFYPVHWSEKARLGGPYPQESYAVHHWNSGWQEGGPPQRTEGT